MRGSRRDRKTRKEGQRERRWKEAAEKSMHFSWRETWGGREREGLPPWRLRERMGECLHTTMHVLYMWEWGMKWVELHWPSLCMALSSGWPPPLSLHLQCILYIRAHLPYTTTHSHNSDTTTVAKWSVYVLLYIMDALPICNNLGNKMSAELERCKVEGSMAWGLMHVLGKWHGRALFTLPSQAYRYTHTVKRRKEKLNRQWLHSHAHNVPVTKILRIFGLGKGHVYSSFWWSYSCF